MWIDREGGSIKEIGSIWQYAELIVLIYICLWWSEEVHDYIFDSHDDSSTQPISPEHRDFLVDDDVILGLHWLIEVGIFMTSCHLLIGFIHEGHPEHLEAQEHLMKEVEKQKHKEYELQYTCVEGGLHHPEKQKQRVHLLSCLDGPELMIGVDLG